MRIHSALPSLVSLRFGLAWREALRGCICSKCHYAGMALSLRTLPSRMVLSGNGRRCSMRCSPLMTHEHGSIRRPPDQQTGPRRWAGRPACLLDMIARRRSLMTMQIFFTFWGATPSNAIPGAVSLSGRRVNMHTLYPESNWVEMPRVHLLELVVPSERSFVKTSYQRPNSTTASLVNPSGCCCSHIDCVAELHRTRFAILSLYVQQRPFGCGGVQKRIRARTWRLWHQDSTEKPDGLADIVRLLTKRKRTRQADSEFGIDART